MLEFLEILTELVENPSLLLVCRMTFASSYIHMLVIFLVED